MSRSGSIKGSKSQLQDSIKDGITSALIDAKNGEEVNREFEPWSGVYVGIWSDSDEVLTYIYVADPEFYSENGITVNQSDESFRQLCASANVYATELLSLLEEQMWSVDKEEDEFIRNTEMGPKSASGLCYTLRATLVTASVVA